MLFLSDQLQLSFFPNGDDLEIGTNTFEVSRGVDELKLIDGAVFAWNTMEFLGQKKNKLNISWDQRFRRLGQPGTEYILTF